jgi:hypothetical protein
MQTGGFFEPSKFIHPDFLHHSSSTGDTLKGRIRALSARANELS